MFSGPQHPHLYNGQSNNNEALFTGHEGLTRKRKRRRHMVIPSIWLYPAHNRGWTNTVYDSFIVTLAACVGAQKNSGWCGFVHFDGGHPPMLMSLRLQSLKTIGGDSVLCHHPRRKWSGGRKKPPFNHSVLLSPAVLAALEHLITHVTMLSLGQKNPR